MILQVNDDKDKRKSNQTCLHGDPLGVHLVVSGGGEYVRWSIEQRRVAECHESPKVIHDTVFVAIHFRPFDLLSPHSANGP